VHFRLVITPGPFHATLLYSALRMCLNCRVGVQSVTSAAHPCHVGFDKAQTMCVSADTAAIPHGIRQACHATAHHIAGLIQPRSGCFFCDLGISFLISPYAPSVHVLQSASPTVCGYSRQLSLLELRKAWWIKPPFHAICNFRHRWVQWHGVLWEVGKAWRSVKSTLVCR